MDQAPKPELSRPRWRTRHKKLVIAGCGLISIVLLLAVAILFFIRSGRLDRYIASQVKSALAEYGLRTEIGGFDLSWGARTAKVRDVKIYNQQTGQLLVSLGRAEIVVDIPDLFALRLKRQVIFKRIDLTDLQAYLSLDQQGRSNLQGVHGVSPSAPGPITFDFSSLVGSLNRGAVYFKDQQHQIECQLTNLKGKAAALPAGSMVALELVSTPETGSVAGSPKAAGQVNNQGRTTAIDSLNFHANAGEAGADILNFTLTSPAVEVKTNGRLDNWASIRYNLAVQARVTLGEISRVLALENEMEGSAAFDGHIGGEGLSYRVTGGVSSDELAASGAQVHGAKIDDISVQSDGKQISFETKQVHVNNVALHGTALSGLTAAGLRGVYTGGRIQAGLDQVGVQRVSLAQGNVDGIKLEHLQGTLQDGNYKVTAGLDIDNGLVSGAQIGKTSGQLVATNNRVDLNKFNAVLMGGSATGDLSIVTEGQGASSLKAALTKLDTRDLFKLGSVSDAPIAGTADVQAQVTWPGTDFNSVSGAIKAQLRVSTTATKNAIPVRGTVDIAAQSGTFNINRAELDTDNSKVVATGQLSLKGDSNLHLSLSSTRAEELQTIAYSIDDLETDVKDYKPQIGGEFRFQGRVTGKLKDPAVEGDLTASSIGINDQALGSLSGHVVFSPTEVGFQNGVLAVTEGGSAKFSYMAPRATAATDGRLDATIDRINIAKLIASAGVSTQQTIVAGEVTGEAHLTGLPGTPTGSAVVNLVNATVLDEPAQTATASLTFDGKAARLDRVDLKLTQGQMSAAGTLDLKSNVFQVQGRADNVDLGRLAESFKLTNPQITGMASATFQATGNTKDLGDLNVQASAQGQNVMVSGQAAGELSLTAKTNSNGRVDAELTTGIAGKPQLLRGSIELRGAGRPIDVQADFVDLNLEPLLLAFAPDVAPSLAGSLSGKLHVTGPIVNEKDEVTPDGLRGSFVLSAVAMQAKERQVNIQTPLTVSLNGSELALTQTRISGQGFDLKLGGTIGLGQDAKMDFGLAGTADLTNLVPVDPDVTIGGSIAIDARIGGTVSEPRLSGGIQMKGLAYSDPDYPIAFDAGNGRIVLAGEKITLEDFTANVNDGAGDVKGSMTLTGLRPTDWQVTASAKNIDVLYAGAAVTLNSDLTLVGNPDGQLLSGTVTMPEGEYTQKFNLDSFSGGGGLSMGGSGGETEPGSSGVPPIVMDIQVNAPSAFLIRNDQINTVASAALNLGGTVDDP
ncbi:MAG TPA: AsmA-like C-terminal region-containing protein, partial [Blastocatellia bacterium]|nr:AsmA-like C-terminal region-containing protein [Blastocatellia bacterium]